MQTELQGESFCQPTEAELSHHVWAKNAPLLYDSLVTHQLDFPSLTCQFLPLIDSSNLSTLQTQKAVIGSQAPPGESLTQLMILRLKTPGPSLKSRQSAPFSIIKPENSVLKPGFNCIQVETRIAHSGDVNRARCCPGAYNLIATKSSDSNLYVFDYSKHPPTPKTPNPEPLLTLAGHSAQGFGLDWAPSGHRVISASNDGLGLLWDLEKFAYLPSRPTEDIAYSEKLLEKSFGLNEARFHWASPELTALAGEDGEISLVDLRTPKSPSCTFQSGKEVFAIDFSPAVETSFLSAGAEGEIKLWDMRLNSKPIHIFSGHTGNVLKAQWNPKNNSLFASSSTDKSIIIWDCHSLKPMFIHKGHFGAPNDFDWNAYVPLGILSVDEENSLQLFEVDSDLFVEESL